MSTANTPSPDFQNDDSKDTEKTSKFISLSKAIAYEKETIGKDLKIDELIAEAKVDPFELMEKPPSVLEIYGIPYGTLGNFSVIMGKPKSRKTFFATMLTIAVLDNNNLIYKGFKTKQPYTNVIYFDTEQSRYHVNRLGHRIVSKLDLKPDNTAFSIYGLRKNPPESKLIVIEEIIYNAKNLSVVIIDGIADLITKGYNDEADAIMISSKLLKWTQELNIHIIVVIHQNKADSNSKGHLGGQLSQKAEVVLDVAKTTENRDFSVVKPSLSRGIDIADIYFTIDENGIPIIVDAPISNASKKTIKKPTDFHYDFKINLIEEVFKGEGELLYKALMGKLKYHLAEKGYQVGDNLLQAWIIYYREKQLILQLSEKKAYKLNDDFISKERIKFQTL